MSSLASGIQQSKRKPWVIGIFGIVFCGLNVLLRPGGVQALAFAASGICIVCFAILRSQFMIRLDEDTLTVTEFARNRSISLADLASVDAQRKNERSHWEISLCGSNGNCINFGLTGYDPYDRRVLLNTLMERMAQTGAYCSESTVRVFRENPWHPAQLNSGVG